MWLVAGLGNPGPGYAMHRHNIGFRVVDELCRRIGGRFSAPARMRAEIAEGRLGPPGSDGARLVLLKSRTFMNDTGAALAKSTAYYKIKPDRLIVVHDELDLDLGRMRVKHGGGDNGHNGLKSIRKSLNTGDYYRIRVGVGRPPGRQDPADFLLSNFPARERDDVEIQIARAADAVESLIINGLDRTQSAFNS
ncbi:aminoacyl-tRNA hydrolase [Microlunatus sp. Gsoil 973]|jgi:PTH1 family peptidyl-tRNA hydrolase|uniref:aminoacyl-tRNA hydrolase n=1 Tax=Microlunatus sp. Gsoil 973 TaxID=2672569 RepID=UPI0012B4D7D4|nr:aminoacyl-tRNA hydrolase [Microlunatus sp. Gsoil 973]QGN33554.1 aminoacyl-tRNA hydrolase [Microlunatus sp. Gsoil 973]